jgi:hypothetical protein
VPDAAALGISRLSTSWQRQILIKIAAVRWRRA